MSERQEGVVSGSSKSNTIQVEFSQETVEEFLKTGEVPDSLRDEFVEQVLARAFP